jgi:hypothetical protein
MASIPRELMDEFYQLHKAAMKNRDFERANAFSSAEDTVNSWLHGRSPATVLSLCKNTFVSLSEDARMPENVRSAYTEAVAVTEAVAAKHGLELVTDPSTA